MVASNWKNLLSLSAKVSPNKSDGHFFWYYRRLAAEFGDDNWVAVVGPKTQTAAASVWWLPVLSLPKGRAPFSPRPRRTFRADMRAVSKIIETASTQSHPAIQFYDGCLDDLVALCYLAPRYPDSAFIFNFRPGKYWIPILSRDKKLFHLLQGVFGHTPRNVFLTAETPALCAEISRQIGVNPEIYPLYSAQEFVPDVAFGGREIDVSFFPKSQPELELCVQLVNKLRGIVDHQALVVIPSGVFEKSGGREPRGFNQIIVGPVEADKYREIFENSKVIFLPYMKQYFQYGSSGKFNDALLAGAIPLVPEGSAPLGQTKGQGKQPEFEFDPEDISGTVLKLEGLLQRSEGFSEKESGVTFEDFRMFVIGKVDVLKVSDDHPLRGWSGLLRGFRTVVSVDFLCC